MKFVRSLENFIGSHLEDFFNRKFSSGVQPVELAKQLQRLIERDKKVGIARVYIPDRYRIYVTLQDFTKLEASLSLISDELRTYVQEYAKKKDYTLPDRPVIEISSDPGLKRGEFRIDTAFSELKQAAAAPAACDELSGTQVFDIPVHREAPLRFVGLEASLTVIEGNDAGLAVDIGGKRVNLGRRDTNDLPLSDVNISRLHAYIVFEQGAHSIYDAKSLNGTYVNQHRVSRKQLHAGDRIRLGNTVILYEVK
ncbi:MAG: DUF3662 and FHA domain-containing protein [Sporomusaceae bacterium]|nr:DUF3662 and FHA domain-containing protein [Sporomusaceae bacterium]